MEWFSEAHNLISNNRLEEALNLVRLNLGEQDMKVELLLDQLRSRLIYSKDLIKRVNDLMFEAKNEEVIVGLVLSKLINEMKESNSTFDKPSVLFIGSKPNGIPIAKIDSEYVAIKETLQDSDFNFSLSIYSSIRPNKFGAILKKHSPNYLHFAGHGVEEVPGFHCQGIVFEAPNKDPVVPSNAAIVGTLRTVIKTVEIKGVILNACYSFQLAKEISDLGIYAIGMIDEILDDSAIAFAEGFYSNFGVTGCDFEGAFEFGVNNISMNGTKYLPYVNVPVIYHSGSKLINLNYYGKRY